MARKVVREVGSNAFIWSGKCLYKGKAKEICEVVSVATILKFYSQLIFC